MDGTTRLKIGEINKNLICSLCGGYFIDATTIIECLHSFCRTCIVTYLKTSKSCPVCDTVVHKTRPHQNIRSDKLLQDLVYKLVPGLYKDEMRRRREFYTCHYEAAPKRPGEERGDEMSDRFAYTEEETISLELHFSPHDVTEGRDFRRVFSTKEALTARMEKKIKESVDVRYLQCKAAVTIGHLKKFVRLKYGLPPHFQVDMFYNFERLRESCTLCDVVYMFNWRRRSPLLFTFCVYESTKIQPQAGLKESTKLSNGTSVTASQPQKKAVPTSTCITTSSVTTAPVSIPAKRARPSVVSTTRPSVVSHATTNTVPGVSSPPVNSVTPCTPTTNPSVNPCPLPTHPSVSSCPPPTHPSIKPCPPSTHPNINPCPPPIHPSVTPSPLPTHTSPSTKIKTMSPQRVTKKATKARSDAKPTATRPRPVVEVVVSPTASTDTPGTKPKLTSSLLGKRPATTPVPIAPAPAKVATLNSSIMDITKLIRLEPATPASRPQTTKTATYVSLLPVGMPQSPNAKCGTVKVINKPSSTITFSVSSILNAMSSQPGVPSAAINHKPALISLITSVPTANTAVTTTSTTSAHRVLSSTSSSSLSSSSSAACHASSVTPHKVIAAKTHHRSHSVRSALPHSAASPSLSSLPLSTSSSSPNNIHSATTTSSASSPTPAESASPIPAAVPVQQSQTQRSDMPHTPAASVPKHMGHGAKSLPKTTAKNSNSMTCGKMSEKPKDSALAKVKPGDEGGRVAGFTEGSTQTGSASDTVLSKPEIKSESTSATTPFSSLPVSSHADVSFPLSSNSSPSPTLSPSDHTSCSKSSSSALSPTSGSTVTCPMKKAAKQKTIADIANTLHKRVSETLLGQVSHKSGGLNGTKLDQSSPAGMKVVSHLTSTVPDLRDASATGLGHQDKVNRQSLQNVPPAGHPVTSSEVKTGVTSNGETDEPLNLVKRDKEMVRLANGMFILDIPPVGK